jgi:hypothetical protein
MPTLVQYRRNFLAVHFRMLSCGMVLVLGGLQVMTERNPSMMRGLLMIPRLVMLAGLTMMFGSVFIVLRGLFVVLVNLEFCHSALPDIFWLQERAKRARNPTLRRSSFIN